MLIAPPPPVPIVAVDRPTQVSAYGSGVLFSKRDPSTGRFKLWYTETGRPPAPLDVPDRAVPFDADLGPGAQRPLPRGLLALRARAALGPGRRRRAAELLARARLRPVRARSDDRCRAPPARVLDDRRRDAAGGVEGRARVRAPVRVRQDPHVLAPRRQRLAADAGRAGRRAAERASTSTAAGWRSAGSTRAAYDGAASDLWLDDVVTGKARRVDRIRGGGLTTISLTAPAFEAGKLYYARLCQGDESGCPHRSGLIRVPLLDRRERAGRHLPLRPVAGARRRASRTFCTTTRAGAPASTPPPAGPPRRARSRRRHREYG